MTRTSPRRWSFVLERPHIFYRRGRWCVSYGSRRTPEEIAGQRRTGVNFRSLELRNAAAAAFASRLNRRAYSFADHPNFGVTPQ